MINRRALLGLAPAAIITPVSASLLSGSDNLLTPVGYMRDVIGPTVGVAQREIFDGKHWVALDSAEGLVVMNYMLGRIP